ncbi:hypothetical protein LDENG_00098340 [Lucifuga dentata]|nr:hypothetical protein LDENG_00098340 [Lucifuga dentata]
MGAHGSTPRKVSFGLDEEEKVTIIEGVTLSEDVLQRMKESQGSGDAKTAPSQPDHHKTQPSPKPPEPSTTEIQEEMHKQFEYQQALVQEQLARMAQREREAAATAGLDKLNPALIIEKGKVHEEKEKARILVSHA